MKKQLETGREVVFRCIADSADTVSLVLYDDNEGPAAQEIEMKPDPFGGRIRTLDLIVSDPETRCYNFRINGRIVTDPAARRITGRKQFGCDISKDPHTVRCGFVSETFNWGDDRPLKLPERDLAAYGLHVRGFTMSKSCGVKNKGTFKGVIEKIPYLQKLGINQLILMPAYEFDEIIRPQRAGQKPPAAAVTEKDDEPAETAVKLNYWGYGPGYYYSPKESYASGRPDIEFREMVRALHRAGIEIIMEFAFPDDTDTAFAIDALSWWVRFYHVDGFRLLCSDRIVSGVAASPLLAGTRLMAGYFDPAGVGERDSSLPRGLTDFNDSFRNDLRRLLRGDENMLQAFAGQMSGWDANKARVVYLTSHDGFTLSDLVSYDQKHNEENGEQNRDGAQSELSWNCGEEGPTRKKNIRDLRMRQMKNALAMLFLSRGIPMIMAGDECCNSQNGNSNPYCIDSETTYVNWNRDAQAREIASFVRDLIRFRRQHYFTEAVPPVRALEPIPSGYPAFSCHSTRAWYEAYEYQNRHIGLMYCTPVEGGVEYLYFAFNFHWDSQVLALPYLPEQMDWKKVMSTCRPEAGNLDDTARREITLPPRSVCILKGVPKE